MGAKREVFDKISKTTYAHFHAPHNERNRFLSEVTEAEQHFLRDFERYAPYTTKGGVRKRNTSSTPPQSHPSAAFYPDLYNDDLLDHPTTRGYPLTEESTKMHADLMLGQPVDERNGDMESWRAARVMTYAVPIHSNMIKGFLRPPHQDYRHYKYYGFAGRGAKTSWAHNPKFKMLGVLPEQEDSSGGIPPEPLQMIVGGPRRRLTAVERRLVGEFRKHSYHNQAPPKHYQTPPPPYVDLRYRSDTASTAERMEIQEPHRDLVDLETKSQIDSSEKGEIESWRPATVMTYRQPAPSPDAFKHKGAPAHGSPASFHQRYKHYKYNGFAGQGAKTSWGRNPKMALLYD